jgi:hypothetical protein
MSSASSNDDNDSNASMLLERENNDNVAAAMERDNCDNNGNRRRGILPFTKDSSHEFSPNCSKFPFQLDDMTFRAVEQYVQW